jgi:hypothetical protein
MNLENHIKNNRDNFNTIESTPVDAIWVGIEHKMHKKARRISIIKIAVAASLLIAVALPFFLNNTQSNIENDIVINDPGFVAEENKYYQLASDKKDAIDYQQLDQGIYGDLFTELDILDSMYIDLKIEISNSPNASRAIETAVRYHERRLHILDLLEKEIENQKRIERHESTVKI